MLPEPLNEPDGLPVMVQLPVAGKPLKATLPVATVQVGWVIVPTTGAEMDGALLTTCPPVEATQLPAEVD